MKKEIYVMEETFSEEIPSNHRGQSGDVFLHSNNWFSDHPSPNDN